VIAAKRFSLLLRSLVDDPWVHTFLDVVLVQAGATGSALLTVSCKNLNRRVAARQPPYFLSMRPQKVGKKGLSPAVGISHAG